MPTGMARRNRFCPIRASRSSIRAPPIRSSPCWRAWSSAAPPPIRWARRSTSRSRARPAPRRTPSPPGSSASRPTWPAASMSASTIRAPLAPRRQGATVAAPIFRDFMKDALADAPPTPFRVAPGIEEVPVDWKSGDPVAAGHARRHHGSLQGRHRAGRGQCAGARRRRCRCRARSRHRQRQPVHDAAGFGERGHGGGLY